MPYKRLITWSRAYVDPASLETYRQLYGMEPLERRRFMALLRERLAERGRPLHEADLILDVPPRDKDTLPTVTVHHPKAPGPPAYTSLAETSAIVSGIGADFLSTVKKIRLFVHPEHAERLLSNPEHLRDSVDQALSSL